MCGQIDENVQINQELLSKFVRLSNVLGTQPLDDLTSAPKNLANSEGRSKYMDYIFSLGLTRSLTDAVGTEDDEVVDAIASQAIAFARLAGFLSSQLPPDADLYRLVIDSVSAGYTETSKLEV